jgi:nucleoside-diphosphate-sugar epimerase
MTASPLHVVFGGTGRAGRAVVQALLAQSQRVRIVNRSGQADISPEVEVVRADLFDATSTLAAARGADVIYNCSNPIQYSTAAWDRDFPILWDTITAAAATTGARLVVADNIYMYGPSDAPLTESTPCRPSSGKGQTRAAMAERLIAAHARGEVQATIGRAGDFYGPHCEFVLDTYFAPALAGEVVRAFLALDQPHTVTFIEDIGRGLVTLGASEAALGKVWHLPNAPAPTQREFIEAIFAELGRKPQIEVLPLHVLEAVGVQNEVIRENLENAYMFERPLVIDSSAFEHAFGVRATPLQEGIQHTLAWMRAHQAA